MREHWPIFYDGFVRLLGKQTFDALRERLKLNANTPEPVFQLTDIQQLALYLYTTPLDYYLKLNTALRNWMPAPAPELPIDILCFALALENALRKLPVYQGLIYRGIQLSDPRDERIKMFPVGQELTWNGFTSCSRDPGRAYPGNTLLQIRSRTGRSLAYFTADDDTEILFSAFTSFHVLDVQSTSEDDIVVSLEEVST